MCALLSPRTASPKPPSSAPRLEASPTERSGGASIGRIAKCYIVRRMRV
jgi:hypothetical protein